MVRLLICFLLLFNTVFAQQFELGSVSKEELAEKFHPSDSSAPAAILYKTGNTSFRFGGSGFSLVTEVHIRIKIYKREGYKYADSEFEYYVDKDKPNCIISDAYTYNLVDGNIEKTKLGTDGEFVEKIGKYIENKKVKMPNVGEGSIIEFKYTIWNPYISSIPAWYFQYRIPANYVEYEVRIPTYYSYRKFLSGTVNIAETKPVMEKGKGFPKKIIKYTAKNVNAIIQEPFVDNIENYMSILKFELISANYSATSEGTRHLATDWRAVVKSIYSDEDFGKQLDEKRYFIKDISALIKPEMSPNSKMEAIFNYVQSRMNWNNRLGYLCYKGVKKAYDDRSGNSAEINLMLTAMLRYAGFNANPVLVSTRSNGVAVYPSVRAYNYVVAGIDNGNGNIILLDATNKYTKPDVLPVRVLNWVGRMIQEGKHPKEIDLTPKTISKKVHAVNADIKSDGTLSGKMRSYYYDYYAYAFRESFEEEAAKEKQIQKIERINGDIIIQDYDVVNFDSIVKPVVEEYSFTHSGSIDVIGDRIYINPLLFVGEKENPFKSEKREYPIDFIFPWQQKYMINISVPEGYKLEFKPESSSFSMQDDISFFNYNIETSSANIQVMLIFTLNISSLSTEYYAEIKEFYQKMVDKSREQIILKKV